ncbi:hypothetical protein AVEN_14950-1 [Araneus ventricosus]|uniref:Uncharacterized protein n=1 Tax=Araneus ventricosus TaxID=182803 RepID=A0A4Y2FAA2_ARAVE|nr:hypothetical protein AVEN_14950-1 [Araneus ventricosus]
MTSWLKRSHYKPFAIPMIWREPKTHSTDWYFCLTDISGITSHSRHTVVYPNLTSAMRPVPHSSELFMPKPPDTWSLDDNDDIVPDSVVVEEAEDDQPPMYADVQTSPMNHLISQSDLNDWVGKLNLSKNQSELLASRLRELNLLEKETKTLELQHNSQEWCLFIDSSKNSLKEVLLHNGNKHPSIPVGYAVHTKEIYENLKHMSSSIEYIKHSWHICADLKVIDVLVGLQAGYTKFCCFLCQWNSRVRKKHYIKKV